MLTSGSLAANVNVSGGSGFNNGQIGVAGLGQLPQSPQQIPEPETWVLLLIGLAAWSNALTAHVNAQATAQSARQTKDGARDSLEALVRALVARLQSSAAVDDAERQAMGIPVYDTTPTPVVAPTTRPVGMVDTSQRLRHSELSFLALDSRTPYLAEYDGEDAGKTAHYMLRWVSARGEVGPWSVTVSATVGG
jgi:hypothetical protein